MSDLTLSSAETSIAYCALSEFVCGNDAWTRKALENAVHAAVGSPSRLAALDCAVVFTTNADEAVRLARRIIPSYVDPREGAQP